MGDVAQAAPPRGGRWLIPLAIASLLVGGAVLVIVFDAFGTDEDDYMPYALDDLFNGRNPYATEHNGTGGVKSPVWTGTYAWRTTYPYLPALAVLQVPLVDYRWTAWLAYGLLLIALADRPRAFWAFGNPAVLWLAASGFNDFVVLALLAWTPRLPRRFPEWAACAAKQFALPLVAVDCALRRDWRRLAVTAAVSAALVVPFAIWSPGDFWHSAVAGHFERSVAPWAHVNYLLYPLFFAVVVWPEAKAARAEGAASSASAP